MGNSPEELAEDADYPRISRALETEAKAGPTGVPGSPEKSRILLRNCVS